MNFLCLFLFFGSVLSSVINFAAPNSDVNFTDLVADVELNIWLVKHLIALQRQSSELTNRLQQLEDALNNFADVLYKPEVMILYCGNSPLKERVHKKIMNKYQRDTVNPFAEVINFKALDMSKFSIPFKKDSITIYSLKAQPKLLAEFESLIKRDEKIFFHLNPNMTDGKSIRWSFKTRLEKYMVRRLRKYFEDKRIDVPEIYGSFLGLFNLAISRYVNNGKIIKSAL